MLRVWRLLEPTTWVGPRQAKSVNRIEREKWRDPPEEIEEEDDFLTGEELKLFQSAAARFNFLAMERPDLLYSVKESMRKMASPRAKDLIALKRVARYTIKYSRMACRYVWTPLDSNIEVYGDANFAGCISTKKSTVGRITMWSGQFVKAWSKTMGVLAMSSGESELASVVRAATEGLGLQSILSHFDLCGHIAIKSHGSAAIGMVHRLGWLWEISGFSTTFVPGKNASPKRQGWRIRVMHKQSTSEKNHCRVIRKHVIGCLSMEKENPPQKSDKKAYLTDGDKM